MWDKKMRTSSCVTLFFFLPKLNLRKQISHTFYLQVKSKLRKLLLLARVDPEQSLHEFVLQDKPMFDSWPINVEELVSCEHWQT